MAKAERPDATVVNALQEGPGELERTPPQFSFEIGDGAKPLEKSAKQGRGDQDRGIFDNDGIAIVCDGMGSVTGAEAADTVAGSLYERVNNGQLDGKTDQEAAEHVAIALAAANNQVATKLGNGELEPDSGSTLGAVLPFTDSEGRQRAVIVGVGDTPVMLARGSTLTKLTLEETVAAEVFEATGKYGEKANVITNVFNGDPEELSLASHNIRVIDVQDGDRFVVTSDGTEELYNDKFNYPEIREWFTNLVCDTTITPQRVATRLVTKDVQKTDDRLVYVVEAQENKPVKPEQPEAGSPTDGEVTAPKRRRGKRGGGAETNRKAARDARAAARAAKAELPSASPDDVPNPIGEDYDDVNAGPYDLEAQDPSSDWDPAGPSGDDSDPFDAWRPFFEGNDRDDDSADPDFSHLPPPPDFSHLPPPPDASSGNPGHGESDDATPYSPEQRELMERSEHVIQMRNKLADMQTKKRWGFAYGFIHRKKMNQLREQYEEAVCRYSESVVREEIANGTLNSDYETVLDRIEELEAVEGAEFVDANANAELTKYGKTIRWVGDKLYGDERTLRRKLFVGAGMGAVALGSAALAPALPGIATAVVGIRLMKAASGGVSGHDSEQGTRRILTKVTDKAVRKQMPREAVDVSGLSPAEQVRLIMDRQSTFRAAYLDSINTSDTKRRTASFTGQVIALGGILHVAPAIRDMLGDLKLPRLPFTHGGGDSSTAPGSGFKNLSPDDVQKFKDASPGISQETLGAIDKNPEAFSRFVTTGQEIKQSTGLSGAALNERLADTLALAHDKNEYIAAARGSGISAEAAGAAFDNRMAEMVFADAVSHIRETTGLTGAELLKRVENTAALAQARDSFVSQGATATERFNRGVLFDEQFRQFAAKLKTQ